jgi:hypothetical protein
VYTIFMMKNDPMTTYKLTALSFDTDGDKQLATDLFKEWFSKEFTLNVSEFESIEDITEAVADAITDETGYCVDNIELVAA